MVPPAADLEGFEHGLPDHHVLEEEIHESSI
jgi:hypothetical protein